MEHVLGIDLGTSNASVAVVQDGRPVLVPDDAGRVLLPAVVAYQDGGEPLIGLDARRRRASDPTHCIHNLVRLLGRDLGDPVVSALQKKVAFPIVAGPSGKACVRVGDQVHSPSEVAAVLMAALRTRAEKFLGAPVRKAVLVAPATFTDPQRLALRLAAQIAGLEVVRILNQSAAAAVLLPPPATPQRCALYGFGGGGFFVAIVENTKRLCQVLGGAGDGALGGDAFDAHLVDHLRRRFQDQHGVDLGDDVVATQRLWGAAESAKTHLTENQTVEVRLREMTYSGNGALDLVDEVNRKDLNVGCQDVVRQTLAHCEEALEAAGLTVGDIDVVYAHGGAARIPLVQESVARFFRRPVNSELAGDGVPAQGAAVYGHALVQPGAGVTRPILDVGLHAVFVETAGRRMRLVPGQAALPAAARRMVLTQKDDQDTISLRFFQGDDAGEHLSHVGELVVEGLKPRPAGVLTLETVVELDVDGVLTVAVAEMPGTLRTAQPVRVGAERLEQDVVMLRMQRGEVQV
jgi:molecular chaperone DnaK